SLPTETWYAVFSALPLSSLLHATLVSQQWHSIVDCILYASLSIHDSLSPAPSRTNTLLATLQARPYLAAYPKRLYIRWHVRSPSKPRGALDLSLLAPAEQALTALSQVLPTLTELTALDLLFGPAGVRFPPSTLLSACLFPSLASLTLAGLSTSTPSALTSFLTQHPTLTHLRLCDTPHALPLPASALPHLTSFKGSPSTAAALLPGRAVASLTLLGVHPEFVSAVSLEHMARACVRVLDLGLMSVTPPLLRDVSRYFTQLQVLRVRLALRHTLHFALSGIALLAALTPVLSSFPLLAELDLSPTDVPGRAQPAEEHSLCATYGRACPSLVRVVFPSGAEWWQGEGMWIGRCL
ncbi:hypothetical protein NEOLEDRAFT_1065699, partial [Neolentinus lepideus HHB14362 ss-1]